MDSPACHESSALPSWFDTFSKDGKPTVRCARRPHSDLQNLDARMFADAFFTVGAQNAYWRWAATSDRNRPAKRHEKEGFAK